MLICGIEKEEFVLKSNLQAIALLGQVSSLKVLNKLLRFVSLPKHEEKSTKPDRTRHRMMTPTKLLKEKGLFCNSWHANSKLRLTY